MGARGLVVVVWFRKGGYRIPRVEYLLDGSDGWMYYVV